MKLYRHTARPFDPNIIKLDRAEMRRAEESLTVGQMTDEDWANHGPRNPNPNKHRRKRGDVA
ncbi:hypothetical protein [Paenibacillus taiwanensis]|uniref:hypothetical protein n=1 Tax=Paenibacillus taiwanensis TaxID=401638 RepID=UPI000404B295|nr:hypothetical protein [Paenibacillus taiwanensis]